MPSDPPAQDRESLTVADTETLIAKEAETGSRTEREIPADAIAIVPVRQLVMFPGMVIPVTLGRPRSVAAAQDAVRSERQIGILAQRDASVDEPGEIDLYRIGTVANVVRYLTGKDGTHHVVSQGEQRFRVVEFLHGWPFLVARIERIASPEADSPQVQARFINLKRQALEALELLPQVPQELVQQINAITDPGALADIVSAYLDLSVEEKQEVLETIDLVARLDRVSGFIASRIEVLRLSQEIGQQTRASLDKRQREVLLREQMAAIQKELGDNEGKETEIAELSEAITKAGMPKEVEDQARRELRRLERMPEAAAEYGMIRTYLDWLIELPWQLAPEAPIDLKEARAVLDEDHFGLDKIKRRIIEYLAVRKLAPEGKAPILCFVGPPGVGKTSLGQSIARAMGRKFVRVSLGGVHDEAEIRGHRRTYVGALPGNIIQGIRRAGARNCVMMLDEIDKLGRGIQGDPSAAMLEVLDPEQNGTFRDNYLAVPFDLSRVVFITTANVLDTIPGPLRDRMEIISLSRLHRWREGRDRKALPDPPPARGERRHCRAGRHHRRGASRHRRSLHAGIRRPEPRARDRSRDCAMLPWRSPRGGRSMSPSTSPTSPRCSVRRASRTRWRCGPACPASPPGSPGLPSAATSCSSRRRAPPAAAG
jgi:ATP-dependent Lon protease